jgi:hypothetical protein
MFNGYLKKMDAILADQVEYGLTLEGQRIDLNKWLGKTVSITFKNCIKCLNCERKINKTFSGGYCFPCSQSLARCDLCILKPELCHYHKGTCREPEWGRRNCMTPHLVYLANTSELKVGITRLSQVPIRWIDQGAISALPIIQVSSRHHSGLFEVLLKEMVPDRTNWRKMLRLDIPAIDLEYERDRIFDQFGSLIDELEEKLDEVETLTDAEVVHINYPVLEISDKIRSLSLDKTNQVSGVLQGIKGQYWILDTGVINIRKHAGYEVTLKVGEK